MKGAAILFGIIIIIAVVYFTGSWVTGEIDFKRVFGPVYTKENAPDIKLIKPNATDITIRAGKEDNKYYVGFQRESPLVQPPEGFTREELSSYYQKVELFGVRAPSTYSGGQFSIRAVSSVSAPVDVTGWRVRTDRGAEIVINGGVNYAGPVNLARILLRPGVAATIYESRGTFVKNVEMNKCTGYLNDTYDFTPDLPNNCPRPDRNDVAGLSSSCQSFVLSLGACRKPTGDEWNRFANEGDLNCLVFLSNLNYENCYREHSAEADFFRYGWRVWLDQAFPFDREGGKLFLLDSAGLLVDVYTY